MQINEVQALLKKYREGSCTEREKALLESWYLKQEPNAAANLSNEQFMEDLTLIGKGLPLYQAAPKSIFPRIAAAASIIIGLAIAAVYLSHRRPAVEIVDNDIMPGSNKATLTLSNGRQITLTNAKNGVLTRQAGTSIVKKANGQILYEGSSPKEEHKPDIAYNTLSTPTGGEYHLILSDGTQVWLDAASTITYPVAFNDSQRKVTVTGEVYFEVAHDPAKPFRVNSQNQTIEVLGTHFNVNAYRDESAIKTTLLEGSVKVTADNEVKIIKPGQQAVYADHGITVGNADVEETVAWKNGYFRFNDATIGDVMRKISKWYDIDVVYHNDVSKEGFTGAISRYKNISQVLKMIAQTGAVKFKVEGRRVTVL